ncbi:MULTISPECIES: heme lyase NrfEFG subunit NrfF [Shewanella]|jgi:cytochrome c-type biogenesis protein CcmH|uniref:heme lyase NrfEFG subunit NrfF n=1 Tax=Shewanella TaxID=22 RepID=UPI00046FAE1B|nr:heme lyase NrfEFG subunit NrfF [Shewanella algae]EKT4489810.1 heme lyase NrfEFG subunit NrfF [Shewanella algae]MBO2546458.1 heme lyase NrfEFG subunit NrfF [Shewanella algae]MBO2563447.1 heme lyase NrfEFG subunit NrfF [Shewanella algae]MBO2631196.1 heme lyase NrfEFG subunit NrfF [Shewanella algae]MBO2647982.1 heme lyase NrfEFG subunit NrfF [Shewanella algae]
MRKLLLKTFAVAALLLGYAAQVAATPVDTFEFSSPDKQKRALSLAHELRCPQCQNQNLIDSNSPVARDLRLEVYKMVEEGKADDEIVQFMTSRYGEFVLYKPRLETKTYVLWLGPVALLLFGGLIGFIFIRKQRTTGGKALELSAEEQRQLDELLKRDK